MGDEKAAQNRADGFFIGDISGEFFSQTLNGRPISI
jgi:hypothetical protein